jgi:TonB family protein
MTPAVRLRFVLALTLSLGIHLGPLLWRAPALPPAPPPGALHVRLDPPPVPATPPAAQPHKAKPVRERAPDAPAPPTPARQVATMAAPPAPTAEEWQLASTYTPKNSKRYRYTWAQQVRSMMGTAVAGEREGLVRVQVEIAPDGRLARVDVLWSTSALVEKLALQAIRSLPPLPKTPTGQPLVFETTIAFLPFETGWPPVYKNDCLPDPPVYKNPFAWRGGAAPPAPYPAAGDNDAPRAAPPHECPDNDMDSLDAQAKDMERQFKEWRSMDR